MTDTDIEFLKFLVSAIGGLIAAVVALVGYWNHRLTRLQTQIQSSQMVLQTRQTEIQDALHKLKEQEQRLALERFKLDMFDKRFEIYNAVRAYLLGVRRERKTGQQYYIELANRTNMAFFLFDSDVVTFLERVREKAGRILDVELWSERHTAVKKSEAKVKEDIAEVLKLEGELEDDLTRLPSVFEHAMRFQAWK